MDSLISFFINWALGLLLLLILQYVVFSYGYRKQRIDVIDIFWGLSFILVSAVYLLMNLSNINIAIFVAFMCVVMWGLRLAFHIFVRFRLKIDQDKRYTEITKSFINNPFMVYVKVFAVQALLASLVTMVILAATMSSEFNYASVVIGLILWIFGFIFESIADFQLKRHIARRSGDLIKTGLWKYSRHPNYFGELVQWWAIWIIVSGGEFAAIGLIGPLLISFLIIYISGIPPLEKHMATKKGWRDYKKSTSMIIPWFRL